MPIDMARAYRAPLPKSDHKPQRIEIEFTENGGAIVECRYGEGEPSTKKAFESMEALESFISETVSAGPEMAPDAPPVAPPAPTPTPGPPGPPAAPMPPEEFDDDDEDEDEDEY